MRLILRELRLFGKIYYFCDRFLTQKPIIMKKYFFSVILGLLLILGSGCTKFEPATVDLSVTPILSGTTYLLDCEGTVTNNGGVKYFNEQGFLFSLKPDPTYKGEDVTTVISMEDVTSTAFDETYTGAIADTIYYVRAYVCTNAGTGYSETKIVSTYMPAE